MSGELSWTCPACSGSGPGGPGRPGHYAGCPLPGWPLDQMRAALDEADAPHVVGGPVEPPLAGVMDAALLEAAYPTRGARTEEPGFWNAKPPVVGRWASSDGPATPLIQKTLNEAVIAIEKARPVPGESEPIAPNFVQDWAPIDANVVPVYGVGLRAELYARGKAKQDSKGAAPVYTPFGTDPVPPSVGVRSRSLPVGQLHEKLVQDYFDEAIAQLIVGQSIAPPEASSAPVPVAWGVRRSSVADYGRAVTTFRWHAPVPLYEPPAETEVAYRTYAEAQSAAVRRNRELLREQTEKRDTELEAARRISVHAAALVQALTQLKEQANGPT